VDVHRFGIPVDRLPDETLLAGLGLGDDEIAVAFVRRFQRRVFAVAVAVVGDPRLAEDIAQQAFERAWRHAQVYDPRRGSVQTWLTTITHNLAVDAARARRTTPLTIDDLDLLVEVVTDTPELVAVASESATELHRALRRLPAGQARAVVLAGVYGMTARQVAEFEAIPLGTAKTRIRMAMDKLRTSMVGEGARHG
jgi:RNA polymerase sigma-70 factor (ECF subfamily)